MSSNTNSITNNIDSNSNDNDNSNNKNNNSNNLNRTRSGSNTKSNTSNEENLLDFADVTENRLFRREQADSDEDDMIGLDHSLTSSMQVHKDYEPNTNHILHGADADLIFLGL
eukprot:Pgem_evm1s71